jgi:hypothetical protein
MNGTYGIYADDGTASRPWSGRPHLIAIILLFSRRKIRRNREKVADGNGTPSLPSALMDTSRCDHDVTGGIVVHAFSVRFDKAPH